MKLAISPRLAVLIFAGLALSATPALAKKDTPPDLMKLCKKECPEAKDLKTTMECVETQEHAGGPASEQFKKTKCFNTHEKFEDTYHKMAGLGHESEAEHDKK